MIDDLVEDDLPPVHGGVGCIKDGNLPIIFLNPAEGIIQSCLIKSHLERFFFTIDGSLIYRTWVLIIFISHHSFIVLSWFHFFHSSPYSNIPSFFFPFPSNLLFFYLFSAFLFFSSVQTFCFNSFIFLTSPFCL